MNIQIWINNTDVTDSCILSATRIAYDSTKRITTASISVMGQSLTDALLARYDSAHYDQDVYGIQLRELYEVQIIDGRDGTTKLFDGNIYAITLVQSDTPSFSVFYQCELNDFGAWLDRSICWDSSFNLTLPNSDQGIIQALLGQFCPQIDVTDVAQLVPTIQNFDWLTKTCRQILDDMTTLSMGEWHVDFNAKLHYGLPANYPAAPFHLSTSPDYSTTYPVKVDGYKHDFTNPINSCYVRGAIDASTGVAVAANYTDPVSVQRYGTYSSGVVDTTVQTGWDAALKAKSTVLTYAYPIETGSFTIWGPDGLACGQQVHIHEDSIGIDGDYIIRSLTMQWVDPNRVQYTCAFGAAQPDLETILRLLNQRTAWATSQKAVATPAPGSVTDASIASPGLSSGSIQSVSATSILGTITAGQIQSVNATSILGQVVAGQIGSVNASSIAGVITAGQIGSLNASVIQGQIAASQIGSVNATSIAGSITATQISGVNATTIQGAITAGQISSVNATTINGVVVSSQLADAIINNLAKYATALTPIQMVKTGDPWPPTMPNKNFPANSFFYYQSDGNFYQVNAAGTAWAINNSPQGSLMSFYYIGAISATSITGLIAAGQIGTITAGQITGSISSAQIGSVSASAVTGTLSASQIGSITAGQITGQLTAAQIGGVNASVIAGQIAASQIQSVNASVIQGSISSGQIGSINAATITVGQITSGQIGSVNGTSITAGTISSAQLNSTVIQCGGSGNMPGMLQVMNASGQVVAQLGSLASVSGGAVYGGWFQQFGAGGTSWANANIYTDAGGNTYVRNAVFTVTSGSYSVAISTTTFDPTYGTLAVKVSGGNDNASLVSRGLVVNEGSNTLGFLVRDPANANNAQMGLYQGSTTSIMLDGASGVVRAINFQQAGNPGVTENVVAGSVTLHFAGGIYIGHT